MTSMVPTIAAAELAFIDLLFHWLFTAISFFGEHIIPPCWLSAR